MAITMNGLCVKCLLNKHIDTARTLGSEETAMAFTEDLMRLFLRDEPDNNSALMGKWINELYQKHFGLDPDRFREEKAFSNAFVLQRLPMIREKLEQAQDPVYTGLQYAILGNYIDFSALGKSVSFETLDGMLEDPQGFSVDKKVYASFCADLQKGKRLLYLTDNAGELGFDMLLAEQLQKRWPHLEITFCVRGGPAHNDATREDAALLGLPFPVIDSGCDVGGTQISMLGEEARQALDRADVVLAKGMGNTESMYGCSYNVYYAFLVKCPRFVQFFNKPMLTPLFLREQPQQ